jgi:hypothetical protein
MELWDGIRVSYLIRHGRSFPYDALVCVSNQLTMTS